MLSRFRAASGIARIRRFSAGLATIRLASCAALYVAPRFDAELSSLVGRSVEGLRAMLEAATGLTVSFDSLSPSVFKTLSLSRLSLRDETGRALLEARKVIIYVDPGALLAGKADRAVTELRLDDGVVDLAFPRDAALFERISKAFGSGGGPALLPQLAFGGRRLKARLSA
ncbi:MAG: hypothetical protein Q8M76_00860, partial [Spirochaetaceae bacterium]|nr:hypothetical protein [Spirochaetaceae bacterium]